MEAGDGHVDRPDPIAIGAIRPSVEDAAWTVLLVDDEPGQRRLFDIDLRRGGVDAALVFAGSATEAMDRLTEQRVDLVVLDLGLPDATGLEALHMVRAGAPSVPVVVLTGLDDAEVGLRAVREGAQDYLVKGEIRPAELARVVKFSIERHELTRQVMAAATERSVLTRLEARARDSGDLGGFLGAVVALVEEAFPRVRARITVDAADDVVVRPSGEERFPDAWQVTAVPVRGESVSGRLTVAAPPPGLIDGQERNLLDRVAQVVADFVDARVVADDLSRRTRQLLALHGIARTLALGEDLAPTLRDVADLLVGAIGADSGVRVVVELQGETAAAGAGAGAGLQLTRPILVAGQRLGELLVVADREEEWLDEDELVVGQVADLLALWVSQRTAAEQHLEAERQADHERRRFRALFDESLDGIVLLAASGRFVEANRAFCRLVGRSRDELLEMGAASLATSFVDPAALDGAVAQLRHAGEARGVVALDRPDGTRVEVEYVMVSGVLGDLTLAIARDVTEQRRAQRSLLASERQFRTLAEQAVEGIFRVRLLPHRSYEYVNPALETITGFSAEEITADDLLLRSRTHPDDATDDVEAPPRTIRFQRADGDWRWLELRQTALQDDQGAITAVQGVVLDVTDRVAHNEALEVALLREQQATEELRELSVMKDTFLRAVSHELRTPLTAIKGFAATLRQHGERLSPTQLADMLTRLDVQASRLDTLLGDLLDIDRLTAGAVLTVDRQELDLAELVADVADHVALGHRVLHLELEPTPASVERRYVERLVHNLVANAAKHTPEGTTIWVTTSVGPDGSAVLTVDDDGPGFDPAIRDRATAPFVQGAAMGASPRPGTGIGLSLVQQFVRLHDGTLEISEAPAGGARIRVVLPRAVATDTGTATATAPGPAAPAAPIDPDAGQRTSKRALVAVSRSIETLALRLGQQGDPVLLLGLFQEPEYAALSRSLYDAVGAHGDVLVGHVATGSEAGRPGLALSRDNPLAEEWTVLLVSRRVCAALVARDEGIVGPGRTIEDARLFVAQMSTDPETVAAHLRRVVDLASDSLGPQDRDRVLAAADRVDPAADALDGVTSQRLREAWAEVVRRSELLQENEPLAMTDPLTGAYTPEFLSSYLALSSPRPRVGSRAPAIATIAFATGTPDRGRQLDTAALDFARIVRHHAGPGALLVREAADAWVLLLPGTTLDEAEELTRLILAATARLPRDAAGRRRGVAAAVAVYAAGSVDLDELRAARNRAGRGTEGLLVLR